MLKEQIEQDLKNALRSKDAKSLSVLRSIKSAITYAEVDKGIKGTGDLDDDAVSTVLAKEAKKRQESADAYEKAGNSERAAEELSEKAIIEKYLPEALSKEEIDKLIQAAIDEIGPVSPQTMGKIIGSVKQKAGPTADGAFIAQSVKDRMNA
ncbi:MAG TPA: GatB/YqeY domain-containing protein [Candidatus Saccharimonadales bacterium]|nr:GatB/YqeY domain-containing protein [Candidatus Saccharimonadales bacterium]